MTKNTNLFSYVQQFFYEYLTAQRGLSQNTIHSYRDVLKLFLDFVATSANKEISKLTLNDLTADKVLLFLKDLSKTRNNCIATRNHRLSAIKVFFSFLTGQDVMNAGDYQKIAIIPSKRGPHRLIDYLEVNEVQAILKSIDDSNPLGERDLVLLTLMYNTGARVQEVCDIRVEAFRLDAPASVLITGKGRKTRQVPLWPKTAKLVTQYLESNGLNKPLDFLFLNRSGKPISRFGVRHMVRTRVETAKNKCLSLSTKKIGPHTFRHSTAMHLLQSGVDLTVIKTWLGHVDISTTHGYIEIDMEMKRKALAACQPLKQAKGLKKILKQNADVIHWLEAL